MKNQRMRIIVSSAICTAIITLFTPLAQADEGAMVNTSRQVTIAQRKPVYFNAMLSGSMLHEDRDNRLTSYDNTGLLTPGLRLRAGGVIQKHHLVGGNLQANWRSTQSVLDSETEVDDNQWGAVSNYFMGPEYRYLTDYGLYVGATVGFSAILADDQVGGGGDDEPDCSTANCLDTHLEQTDDHASFGVAVMGTVGYEYRIKRYLSVNVEAFVGVLHGEDEYDENMTNATYGMALGVGI